jgi:hypothetical protein
MFSALEITVSLGFEWQRWLASRVLQNLLNNMSRSKYKSWGIFFGEENVKRWIKFDSVLVINFGFTLPLSTR